MLMIIIAICALVDSFVSPFYSAQLLLPDQPPPLLSVPAQDPSSNLHTGRPALQLEASIPTPTHLESRAGAKTGSTIKMKELP